MAINEPIKDRADRIFLSALASTLLQHKIISGSEADKVRIAMQDSLKLADLPLSSIAKDCECFHFAAESYFGNTSIFNNYLRRLLIDSYKQILNLYEYMGNHYLSRTELFFNRPFYFFRGDTAEIDTVFSAVLMEFSASIWKDSRVLQDSALELNELYPSSTLSPSSTLNSTLAENLGIPVQRSAGVPFYRENRSIYELATTCEKISESIAANRMIISKNLNLDASASSEMEMNKAEIHGLCTSLKKLNFSLEEQYQSWEVKSVQADNLLKSIHLKLKDYFHSFISEMKTANLISAPIDSNDKIRSLAQRLLQLGHSSKETRAACDKLRLYCRSQSISLRELTVLEASKVSHIFTTEMLQEFTEQDNAINLSHLGPEEKDQVLQKYNSLKRNFRDFNA